MQIDFTPAQIQIIINALAAVSPSGGGSNEFTLQRYISSCTGMYDQPEQVMSYSEVVLAEAEEAGVITRQAV